MDIVINNAAKVEIDKLLENSDKKYIRIITRCITMHEDAKFDLILDEKREGDRLFEVDGYNIIIESNFADQIASMIISYGGLMSRYSFSIHADFGFYEY